MSYFLEDDRRLLPDEEVGCAIIDEQTIDPVTQYVADGAIVDRPTLHLHVSKSTIAADGSDQCVISRIPVSAVVQIGERDIEPTDGQVALTSTIPGVYAIVVRRWPYLDFETTIEAT